MLNVLAFDLSFLLLGTKYTVATDKSVVTLTLDTEIIKLDTPFFSLHLAEYQPNLLDNPPIFFSICFHKILL
jgi:hypothetical protein